MPTLLATVVALLIASIGDSLLPPPAISAYTCLWVATLGALSCALPGAILWALGGRARRTARRRGRAVRAARWATILLALALQALLTLELDWPLHVKSVVSIYWPGLAQALALVPFASACLLGTLALTLAQRRLRLPREPLRAPLARAARGMLVVVVPYVVFMGVGDLQVFFPVLAERLALDPLARLLGFAVGLPIALLLAPFALGALFPSRVLAEEPLRSELEDLARQAEVGYRQIRVWHTGARGLVNACVTGFMPWTRFIFFTDGLLVLLDVRALPAVFAHELGHVRRHHFRIFALLVCALLLVLLAPFAAVTEARSEWLDPLFIALVLIVPVFLLISRQFEYEADAYAGQLLQDPVRVAATLGHLASFTAGGGRRGSWRHPSLVRRQQALLAQAGDPHAVQCLARRGRVWRGLVLLVVGGAGFVFASELAAHRARPTGLHRLDLVHHLMLEQAGLHDRPGVHAQAVRQRLERARALVTDLRTDPTLAEHEAHVADLERMIRQQLAALPTGPGA